MGAVETYDLLAILDFNNVRKRMSVSIKHIYINIIYVCIVPLPLVYEY